MPTIAGLLLVVSVSYLVLRYFAAGPLLAHFKAKANMALDIEGYNAQSDYSRLGYCPIHSELSDADVVIEGDLPSDLTGVYLRNGTNSPFSRTESRRHMFNGAGMIHQVHIDHGRARYANRYTQTPRYLAEVAANGELYPEFGDIAGGGKPALAKLVISLLEQRFGITPKISSLENGAASTAIQFHHGQLYALQETNYPFSLDVKTDNGRLRIDGTGHYESFGGILEQPFTAHPKIDPATGDWYSFSTHLESGTIHYNVLSRGALTKHVEVMTAKPSLAFLHDCYLTQHHVVLPDLSLRFDPKALRGEHASAFFFDADYKLRFGVIKRGHHEGDAVQWFETDAPGHIWHTINGWEEQREDGGTDIVLFAPVFRSYPSNIPIHSSEEPHAPLCKFRLALDSGKVTEQRVILEDFYERPTINTEFLGKPSRYAYLLDEGRAKGIMGKGILKYDLLKEQQIEYFDYGDYRGGEALFVPRPNSNAEDDGYLLDILSREDQSYLVIIDATSMEERARLHMPQRVPYGVHACWLGREQLDALTGFTHAERAA